jgi:hypothetical protein
MTEYSLYDFFISEHCPDPMKGKLKDDKQIEIDAGGNTPYDYGFLEDIDFETV